MEKTLMLEFFEILGEFAEDFRECYLKLTRSEMAREIGVNVMEIARFENGMTMNKYVVIGYALKGFDVGEAINDAYNETLRRNGR